MKTTAKISKKWQKISFSSERSEHYPVLYRELIDLLEPEKRKVVVDATLGMAGHSSLMLKRMPKDGVLIGMDRDSESLETAKEKLAEYGERFRAVHSNHGDMGKALSKIGIESVDAVIFDLGLSMYQMDSSERGFSFLKEGPLDMRMDRTEEISAYEIVNEYSQSELTRIFRELGGEYQGEKIARLIIERRKAKPLATTFELADLVIEATNAPEGPRHPATKIFQALRIAVNKEFESFENGLKAAFEKLSIGGRIAVITFHSDEDRAVKYIFKAKTENGEFELVNKKVVVPEYKEIRENSRSRSAKLRVIERIC